MLDTKRLLDQFIGPGGMPDQASGTAPQGGGQGQAGGLGGALGGLIGDPGSFGKGALAGGLAGYLLGGGKKKKKLAKNALKFGGVALVGGLAYKAWRNWEANKQAGQTAPQPHQPAPQPQPQASAPELLPPPQDTAFAPSTAEEEQGLARKLLTAMIAAAKADGHIDAQEQSKIFSQIGEMDLDADDKAFVMDELARPLDVESVAKLAATPEEAAEIYAASLLAIDLAGAAEKGYLAMLAARLKLDQGLVQHLHQEVAAVEESA
jgi:uncharacterized membrane protein YebE (DUF533 family)